MQVNNWGGTHSQRLHAAKYLPSHASHQPQVRPHAIGPPTEPQTDSLHSPEATRNWLRTWCLQLHSQGRDIVRMSVVWSDPTRMLPCPRVHAVHLH